MSDPFGDISSNVSFFPPGSFHAVTSPGQIGYFRETSPVAGMGFAIQLTCDTDKGWGIPTVYQLEVAFRETALYSRNAVFSVDASPGTRVDRSSTTGYQTLPNLWKTACYFTNDPGVLHPTITFIYSSGTVSATSPVNIDLFRFTEMTPYLPLLYFERSGSNLVLSWFTNAAPCVLCQSTNLGTGWEPVTNVPVLINGLSQVTIEQPLASCCFYRLQR